MTHESSKLLNVAQGEMWQVPPTIKPFCLVVQNLACCAKSNKLQLFGTGPEKKKCNDVGDSAEERQAFTLHSPPRFSRSGLLRDHRERDVCST